MAEMESTLNFPSAPHTLELGDDGAELLLEGGEPAEHSGAALQLLPPLLRQLDEVILLELRLQPRQARPGEDWTGLGLASGGCGEGVDAASEGNVGDVVHEGLQGSEQAAGLPDDGGGVGVALEGVDLCEQSVDVPP